MSLPRLAVFASGNGSNLQVIIDLSKRGEIQGEVVLVVSDQENAFAVQRAKKAGVRVALFSRTQFPAREEFDQAMAIELKKFQVEWVLLAGFMRILSKSFVQRYKGRILNIHPSLLPQYPGLNSIERALEAKEKSTGVTVHFVDEGVDTGQVILQRSVAIEEGESLETLTEKVHALEHTLYPEAIQGVLAGKFVFGRELK